MMRSHRLIASAAAAMLLVEAPALATPAQDLDRAYRDLYLGRYPQARDGARAYLQANGPRFSAAFILAVAECMVHPHLRSNALAFRQLKIDYDVTEDKTTSIYAWMGQCSAPAPPPARQEAGVSGSALTSHPSIEPGHPSDSEPPPRRPRSRSRR